MSDIRVPQGSEERTLDAYIRSRVGGLPAPSRSLLEVLSVAGTRWNGECSLRQRDRGVRPRGPDPAEGRSSHPRQGAERLLVEPYHDRIRQSVLVDVPEPRAREIHLALAEAMEREPKPDAQTLCLHFPGRGSLGQAGQYALLAAEQAVGGPGLQPGRGILPPGPWRSSNRGVRTGSTS